MRWVGRRRSSPVTPTPIRAVPESAAWVAYQVAAESGQEVPELEPLKWTSDDIAAVRGFPPVPATPPPAGGSNCVFPPAYDLRSLGRVTPATVPLFSCGTCWTAAALGSLESNLTPQEYRDFSTAAMELEWGPDGAMCGQGGSSQAATYYLASWRGPVNESDYPFPGAPAAVQKHVQNVYYLPNRTGPLDNCWIKWAVTYMGGVYSAISRAQWSPNWDLYDAYYHPTAGSIHAVTIVGWDDHFDRNLFYCGDPSVPDDLQVPPGDGAFIVKDNGGPTWHDNGFFYVSYYDGSIGTQMAVFTGEPIENYGRMYTHAPYGVRRMMTFPGSKKNYSWQADVFTAVADEEITAVSFYELYDANMDYRAEVYLDPVGGPTSAGGPAASVEMSLMVPGYFTLKLPSGVPVKKGQRFGVVLRGHERSGGWPAQLGIETPESGFSKVTGAPKQSWFSTDGTTWQDLTKVYAPGVSLTQADFCIQAFTKAPVTAKVALDTDLKLVSWDLSNDGAEPHWVKPVARLYERTPDGLFPLPEDPVATEYEDDSRTRMPTDGGWILLDPGASITAYAQDDRFGTADRVTTNLYHVGVGDETAHLVGNWKLILDVLTEPLHVVSTDPAGGAQVNYLGLSLLTVTFDAAVKPGPGLSGITVSSSSGVETVWPTVNGTQLVLATAGPLGSNELGGTTWTVHLPADAVVSETLSNPLAQDYEWSFTVTGVN